MRILYFLMFCGLIISCQKPVCSQASECSGFAPPSGITCHMYVEGYYYDASTNKCTYYQGSACSAPVFEKRSDCIACECVD